MPWKTIPVITKDEEATFLRENKKKARFLVDQNVDTAVVHLLRKSGWNAQHATEVGLEGQPDENILGRAQRDDRILLTHDPDFLNDRVFPPHRNPGVVVLPGAQGNRRAVLAALRDVLPVVGAFRELWRAAKIGITEDGTWTVTSFDHDLGCFTKTRYRFPKNQRAEYWLDEAS
jgi:predicted nuclease of predicted toxin-antitoxin system